jgi:DNA-binding MarR family transcriptional regulator
MSAARPLAGLLELDRAVHEPARLAILTVLASANEAEFRFLETATGLTPGNLSSHTSRLEQVGYLKVRKTFRGRVPVTWLRITPAGREALSGYWATLQRASAGQVASPPQTSKRRSAK